MKTSTARDLHCCAVSQQKGEISPQQEKSESNNTQSKPKEERVWSVLVHLSTPSFSSRQSRQAGKPSVTFLNISLSIFVTRCQQNDFTPNVQREICGEWWVFGVNFRKWLDKAVLDFYFKRAVPRSPCCVMLNSEN